MSRQPFNTRWAQGVESQDNLNTFKDPEAVRISTGWEGGQDKDAPPAGHENWWHNRVDSGLQGLERMGVMPFHPLAIYSAGAPTYASDGNYYESIASGNAGNDPVSTSGFWRFVGASFFSGADPGDIKTVAHNNPPTVGWLKCNGAVVLRASYPRLFNNIGTTWNTGGESSLQFRLPDFRGEFLRVFDDGKGVDPSRVFGSFQNFEVQAHSHGNVPFRSNDIDRGMGNASLFSIDDIGVTGSTGGSETRPRNKTVNCWIKY
ncbi:tail fiber protein [Pseudomonas fluorescens]|nr:tail fiber protein [Pseudomonas fluorescens]